MDQPGTSGVVRLTVEEAAKVLGIKEESVRKRVSRGTLAAEKDQDGRLLVRVDTSVTSTGTVRDESGDPSVTGEADQDDQDALLTAKDETISILRDQLREEREARRRADTLLAQLMQRIPELEAPASEAEPQEPPGASESAEEVADRGSAPPERDRPVERPWWRRVFGG